MSLVDVCASEHTVLCKQLKCVSCGLVCFCDWHTRMSLREGHTHIHTETHIDRYIAYTLLRRESRSPVSYDVYSQPDILVCVCFSDSSSSTPAPFIQGKYAYHSPPLCQKYMFMYRLHSTHTHAHRDSVTLRVLQQQRQMTRQRFCESKGQRSMTYMQVEWVGGYTGLLLASESTHTNVHSYRCTGSLSLSLSP